MSRGVGGNRGVLEFGGLGMSESEGRGVRGHKVVRFDEGRGILDHGMSIHSNIDVAADKLKLRDLGSIGVGGISDHDVDVEQV